MTAREQILGEVRKALGRTPGQAPRFDAAPLPDPTLRIPQSDRDLRVDLFVEKFEALGGKSFRVRNAPAVVPAIAELLAQKSAVASNSPFLRKCGVTGLVQVHAGFTERDELKEACAAAHLKDGTVSCLVAWSARVR